MTWLYILNRYFLQFLFIRLARNETKIVTAYEPLEISILADGGYGVGARIKSYEIHKWFSIMYWVKPFTGWSTDYKYLGPVKYLKVSKTKIIYG